MSNCKINRLSEDQRYYRFTRKCLCLRCFNIKRFTTQQELYSDIKLPEKRGTQILGVNCKNQIVSPSFSYLFCPKFKEVLN
jgi:hypothetical protein